MTQSVSLMIVVDHCLFGECLGFMLAQHESFKEHSVLLTLPVASVDDAQTLG